MKLPNAENAVIARDKICEYLLNPEHVRGSSKANLLLSLGYRIEDWQRLEMDVRRYHLPPDMELTRATDYGERFEIVAPLLTPSGRSVTFRSIWQIDLGTDYPRFITMYPG